MEGIRPLGFEASLLSAAAPVPVQQPPLDSAQLTRDLAHHDVTFRRRRSFLWWHWYRDVSAEKAAKLAEKGKPGKLEASWKGCDPVPVTTVEDLRTLGAFYATRVAASLASPVLGKTLLGLEVASTVFKGQVHGEDRDVGAYGAYTVLTGNPQGIESLRADGEALHEAEDALFMGFLRNKTQVAALSKGEAARSIQAAQKAGCALSTGEPLASYRALRSSQPPKDVAVTHKGASLFTVPASALDQFATFAQTLADARARYDSVERVAHDRTRLAWDILRDDGSTRPFADRLALLMGVVGTGLEHPEALYRAALAKTNLVDAEKDAVAAGRALGRGLDEEAVVAFEELQTTPNRAALLARLPKLAQAHRGLVDVIPDPTPRADRFRGLMALDDAALDAVAGLADAARAFRPDAKWTPAPVDGRPGWDDSPGAEYANNTDASVTTAPISLRGLHDAVLVFRESHDLEDRYDYFSIEAREPGGQWTTVKRLSGSGGDRRQTVDLSAFNGRTAEVRFHLTTDSSGQRSGVTFSDVRLRATDNRGRTNESPLEQHIAGPAVKTLSRLLATSAPPAALSRGVQVLGELTRRLGTARDASTIWEALSPRMADADLPDRADAAVRLAQSYGPDDAVRLLAHLEARGTGAVADRLSLLETAQRLVDTSANDDRVDAAVDLYDCLDNAHVDPALRKSLDRIAALAQPWQAEAPWGRVRRDDGVPAWEDSPGRAYDNGTRAALTSGEVSLDGLTGSRLTFEEAHALEDGYDHCHVEVSKDGGSWEKLLVLDGDGRRKRQDLDLGRFDGQRVRVRFRMDTDSSGARDGVQLAHLRMKSTNGVDVPIERRVVGPLVDHAIAIATDAASPRRAVDLDALARLVDESKSMAVAAETWPLLAPHTTEPDAATRRATLARLARMGDADAVRRAWAPMASFTEAERAAALRAIETIASKLGDTTSALDVWSDLAPHYREPGFQDLVAARSHLVAELGAEGMRTVWPEISGGTLGTANERAMLFDTARDMANLASSKATLDEATAVYRRLVAGGVDPAARARLEKLATRAMPWKAAGTWGRIPDGWSDSPRGQYANGRNDALSSAEVPLDGLHGTQLVFDAHYALEDGYDDVSVEASSDGSDWRRLAKFTGARRQETHRVDISAHDGRSALIRFQIHTDSSGQRDGFDATDIHLEARDDAGRAVRTTVEERVGAPVLAAVLDAVAAPGLDPAGRAARLDLLERLEKDLGASALAARLLPALLQHVGGADLDARRQDLAKLARAGGAKAALAAWPHLDAMPAARRASEMRVLEEIAVDLHGNVGSALSLWTEEAAAGVDARFTDRVRARAALQGALPEAEARRAWDQLSKGADMRDDVERYLAAADLARVYTGRAGEQDVRRLVAELRTAGVDATAARGLRHMLSGEGAWTPAGEWARVRLPDGTWGWSDSPDKAYKANQDASLTAPLLDLTGRTGARLRFDVGYDLENGYDVLTVEASTDRKTWKQLDSLTGQGRAKGREVDLSACDGRVAYVRFRLKTDGSGNKDGVTLSNLRVRSVANGTAQEHEPEHLSAVPVAKSLLSLATDATAKPSDRAQVLEFIASLPREQSHKLLHTVERARADGLLQSAGITPMEFLVRVATTLTVADDLDAAMERAIHGTKAGKVEVGEDAVVIGGIKVPVREGE